MCVMTIIPLEHWVQWCRWEKVLPRQHFFPTAPETQRHHIRGGSGPALLLHRLRFRQQGGRIVGRILVVIHFGFVVVVAKMLNIVVVVAFSIEKIKRNRRDSCMGFVEKTWESKVFGCSDSKTSPDCWPDSKTTRSFGSKGR
ncbi:hypothetical protein Tco_1291115 [Tanacetum coccineum]